MPHTLEQNIARAAGRLCCVEGCFLHVDRIGSYCAKHGENLRRTGHVSLGRVTGFELRPWVRHARRFVVAHVHAGHPGVLAAVAWFTGEMNRANPIGTPHKGTRPAQRYAHWLDKMKRDGHDAEQVLAVAVAVHWFRLEQPRRFPDDRYFERQLGHRVASIASRARVRSGAGAVKGLTRTVPACDSLCRHIAAELRITIGPLLHFAAAHLHRVEHRRRQPVSTEAMRTPFVAPLKPTKAH